MIKECVVCGDEFTPTNEHQKMCGGVCLHKFYNKHLMLKVCRTCNKNFTTSSTLIIDCKPCKLERKRIKTVMRVCKRCTISFNTCNRTQDFCIACRKLNRRDDNK